MFGPKGALVTDHVSGTLLRQRARSDKSYLTFFLPPLRNAVQNAANGLRNMVAFLRRRLYQDAGMKELIQRFYRAIEGGDDPPIPYREILLTSRIMDQIFEQVYGAQSTGATAGGETEGMESTTSNRDEENPLPAEVK